MAQQVAISQDRVGAGTMAVPARAAASPSAAAPRTPPTHDLPRPNGMSELELLRTITSGFTSFGNAVRLSGLSHAQRSRVLAHLAEASTRMMEATNAYLFELSRVERAPEPVAETVQVRPRRPLRAQRHAARRAASL